MLLEPSGLIEKVMRVYNNFRGSYQDLHNIHKTLNPKPEAQDRDQDKIQMTHF